MPICILKQALVAVIVPLAHTGSKEKAFNRYFNKSDGRQNPQSSFCAKMHSEVLK